MSKSPQIQGVTRRYILGYAKYRERFPDVLNSLPGQPSGRVPWICVRISTNVPSPNDHQETIIT